MTHFDSLPTAICCQGSGVCLHRSNVSFYRQKGRLDLDRAAIGGAELQAWAAVMPSATSYAERQNLNIRMGNRRMTRLTNAFSKKAVNHDHMMAVYFMHYNFVRIHQTLKVTPAMAVGVTSKLWEMADMVKVLETCAVLKVAA